MTTNEIISRIEKAAAKETTTKATYNLVRKFWAIETDVPTETILKVQDLEARMEAEHGWTR